MILMDKIKEVFAKIFNKNSSKSNIAFLEENNLELTHQIQIKEKTEEKTILLEDGVIAKFSGEVLDTNSKESIEKLKHNLQILTST